MHRHLASCKSLSALITSPRRPMRGGVPGRENSSKIEVIRHTGEGDDVMQGNSIAAAGAYPNDSQGACCVAIFSKWADRPVEVSSRYQAGCLPWDPGRARGQKPRCSHRVHGRTGPNWDPSEHVGWDKTGTRNQ